MNKKITFIINFLLFMAFFLLANPATAQSNDEQYRKAIESADNYFKASDYLNAKASYQVASQLKPSEQYPKDRMQESISRLRVQLEKMAAYNDKLAYADQLYDEESYVNAIVAYEEARKLMPSDEYPVNQIELIKKKQIEEAQTLARYQQLINDGDALFASTNFSDARTKYEEASNIYPDNPEAKDKMEAADDRLAEIAAQQTGYQKALSEAEMYHARKDYEKELQSYELASELKPEEAFPQIKIRELNEFLRKYEGYNKFVTEADELYITQQFAEAKVKYEQALEILPDESYPKEIISKINIALSEKTERDKAAYDEAIAKADELYSQEDYDAAMVAYSDALRFWPEGAHAKARLSSISEIRALQRAQEEAYTNSISKADKFFADKDYQVAKSEYRKAADIKPFEQYPKVRLEEIDMILAELQNKLDQYESIILGADKLFNSGDYSEARIQYLKAQEILSDRTYPEDQIKMIDEILGLERAVLDEYLAAIARADEHFALREWEDAKVDYVTANDLIPEEQYPDDKITEINDILARLKAEMDNYTLALKNADQLFAERDYSGALAEYQKASAIFSDEEYPRQKIEEINSLMADLEAERALEENYANTIVRADELFVAEDYAQAKAEYEKAIALKAGDEYPTLKVTEIDNILAEQARMRGLQESYAEAIAQAEQYFDEEQYNEARMEYLRAAELMPDESLPAEKIAEIDAIFAAETEMLAQLEADYTKAIADADAAFAEADYTLAREKYNLALSLKAGEAYPSGKLTEIDGLMADQEAQRILDENYASSISSADKLFAKEDYTKAKVEYEKAIALKAGEEYPQQRITEIDNILAEQSRLLGIEESYNEAIAQADQYFKDDLFAEARAEYSRALEIKAAESYPTEKITEIDGILGEIAAQQALDEEYSLAIAKADELFDNQSYLESRAAYEQAAILKPREKYPEEKIASINGILADEAAEAERLAKLEADYTQAISDADAAFAEADYVLAKQKYTLALGLKSGESYPGEKITEIDGLLSDIEAQRILDENYTNAIENADKLFDSEDYTLAKAEYEKAIALKTGEEYPQQKVTEIDGILAEQARLMGIEQSYTEAIATADQYFGEGQYAQARAEYSRALEIKAAESYPASKITEIDGILEGIAAQEAVDAEYALAIAKADDLFGKQSYSEARTTFEEAARLKPGEEYPAEKIASIDNILAAEAAEIARLAKLEADYTQAISDADAAFAEADYVLAKEKYTLALGLKSGEAYPGEKIIEIDGLLADMEAQRILDENYSNAIAGADELFNSEDYTQAKAEYQKAIALKSNEQYPQDKITEIDGIIAEQDRLRGVEESYLQSMALADQLLSEQQYDQAKQEYARAAELKPDETLPPQKITEIEGILAEIAREEARLAALDEQYRIALETADNYFNEKKYAESREAYVRARDLKAEENYPVEKITEIDNILTLMEEQRQIEEGYSNAIALGENHFNNKEYAEARAEFEKALTFKASEQYPQDKITEIDGIINEEARLRELAAAYAAAIASADGFLSNQEYEKARESYQNALSLKPGDTYASGKVTEIGTIIAEATRLKVIEDSYNAAITSGDQAFAASNYTVAREAYTSALGIKANESYPGGKITEIDDILAENARVAALNREYDSKVKSADSLFSLGEYENAKASYSDAVRINSEEEYPMQRIDEIDALLAEIARQKALDESYAQAVKDADDFMEGHNYLLALQTYEKASELKPDETYPPSKIAEINSKLSELEEERNKAYDAAIVQADGYYDIGNFRSAKSSYQNAVQIKPDEQYARDRLDEVTKIYMAQVETLKVDYRKYIADADNYFNDKIYDGAIENYRLASAILPDEEYPGKMISRITQIINDNAITDVNQLAQVIPNNTERKFNFSSLPVGVRKQNYILIKARNLSDNEFKMLVSFGQDASKTGGVVLQVPIGEGVKDYIIRIGAIYKWFTEDNNWLSIYPEGGDLEVALIRISKSD